MQSDRVLGGRYRLERQLGSGGMAVVWAATDEVLGRAVAVKMLAGRHSDDPVSLQRIRDEARIAATLSHPHIAQVHDYGEAEEDGRIIPYVVMELVAGPTLAQRTREGPLPPPEVFRICAQIAEALSAAHAADLVHRDIKPANVIVTPAGAKVVDFGIAASVSPSGDGDLPEVVLGTPSYLAPERLTDDAVAPASDVYALGVLLYELLAGRRPWQVDTPDQQLEAHVSTAPAPLPELPGVPAEVADLSRRCLLKDPAQRPDAVEVAAVLSAAAAGPGPAAPSAPVGGPAPRSRTRFLVAAGAGLSIAAAGLVAAAMAGQPPGRPSGANPSGRPSAGTSTRAPGGSAPDPTAPGGAPRRTGTGTASAPGVPGVPGVPGEASAAPASPAPEATTTGTGTAPAPPSASPPGPPPAQERTLSSAGGTVRATCTAGGLAHLLSWTPAKTYQTSTVVAGPAATAVAAFRHGNTTVRMSVTCTDGVPSATTS